MTTYVPIEDVAKCLSVSVTTVRVWLRKNLVPRQTYVRIGNTYRFDLDAVVKHLSESVTSEVPGEGKAND